MKATLIISQEYKHNQPSVFILAEDNQYYGCLLYPSARNYPMNDAYWLTATSSDSDRNFSLFNVEYSDDVFEQIKKLQSEIKENESCLKHEKNTLVPCPNASKSSKIYKEYLEKKEAADKLQRDAWEYNKPFEKVIYANRTELRKILLSVLPNEN